ncbi:hypothetical protein MD535_16325 [Vibrio sp. ZSDZ65]|uniref:Outer membrane protein beta-barrel domain-containing protein n=1 Tax=Vibrio qingdaonensis TaxID=2829491 RepID=A0A9X3HXQ8_9VIBR|nr:hypothetical protein [Vibrio qingdaonensis]MCW8347569.1 hypothetical protein [Vibrio qingdaonensis]
MMKKALLMASLLAAPFLTHAHTIQVSPELKIGAYRGAGLQVGLPNTLGFDAVFFDYGHTRYSSNAYDETLHSYRVGLQQMFGQAATHGFQVSIGGVQYDGSKREESRSATGVSIGANYVYQMTDNLAVRTGLDINVFDNQQTYIPADILSNWNLGFILRF